MGKEQRAGCSGGLVVEVEAAVSLNLAEGTALVQHRRGDRPASSLGSVSMGKEQRAVCNVQYVVEVLLLKLG